MKQVISYNSNGNKFTVAKYSRPKVRQCLIPKQSNSSQSVSNNKTLVIGNRSDLELLRKSRHETIIFDTMANVRFPSFNRETELPTFARNLVLHRCDKNLVFFATHSYYFSSIQNVYMNSHPCEPCVLPRLSNSYINVYLTPSFHQYKDRWATGLPRIHNIPERVYNELLKAFGYKNVW